MSSRRLRAAFVLLITVSSTCVVWTPTSAAGPSATATPDVLAAGDTTMVTGSGFPSGEMLQVSVCGNAGKGGAASCAVRSAVQVAAADNGAFKVELRVARPPVDCPCVILVETLSSADVVAVPITLANVPVSPVEEPEPLDRSLQIVSATVLDDGPWTAMIGAADRRTLVLSIVNVGDEAVVPKAITALVGPADGPDQYVSTPEPPPIPARGSAEVRIPVDFGMFAHGEQAVEGRVIYTGGSADFRAEVDLPLMRLLVVPAFIVFQVLLVTLWLVLRRLQRPAPATLPPPAPGQPFPPPPVPATPVDA